MPRRWRAATGAGDTRPEARCVAVAESPDHACHAARQPRLTKNALCLLVPLCATKWLRALLSSILQARTLWGKTAGHCGHGSMTYLHKSRMLEGFKGFHRHCYCSPAPGARPQGLQGTWAGQQPEGPLTQAGSQLALSTCPARRPGTNLAILHNNLPHGAAHQDAPLLQQPGALRRRVANRRLAPCLHRKLPREAALLSSRPAAVLLLLQSAVPALSFRYYHRSISSSLRSVADSPEGPVPGLPAGRRGGRRRPLPVRAKPLLTCVSEPSPFSARCLAAKQHRNRILRSELELALVDLFDTRRAFLQTSD